MVVLNCVIIRLEHISINIDVNWNVVFLKLRIKNAMDRYFAVSKLVNQFGALDLQLYLAKTDDGWLDEARAETVATDKHGQLQGFVAIQKTPPFMLIKDVLEVNKMTTLTPGKAHVLVVVPESPVQEATAPTTAQAEKTKRPEEKQRTIDVDFSRYGLDAITAIGQGLSRDDLAVGKVVELPETVLGTRISKGLYVRKEYWDLYDMIKRRLANPEIRRILVLGSPGIGKSVFGVFLLLVFMTEKRNIAYRSLGRSMIYFFTWDDTNGYEISGRPLVGKMYQGLFDGNDTFGAVEYEIFRHAYVFASPCTTNYNDFVKEACFKVYMNPWTKAECQSFADAIALEDQDKWFRRFNLVGGNPRFLFSSDTFDVLLQSVKSSIPRQVDELKSMVSDLDNYKFEDRMKHSLFLFYREEDEPSRSYLTFSSVVVEAIVSARCGAESAEKTRLLLKTLATKLQSWRGRDIEKILLQDLAAREFCMRPLEGNSAGIDKKFGPLDAKSMIIQASSEIQNELMLYIPLSKTFPAIDAVLVVPSARLVIYAQATVGKGHPIKYQHLKDVYEALTRRREFGGYTHILLYIVPDAVYDRFSVQPYKNEDGKLHTEHVDISVAQYVGKITGQESQKGTSTSK